MGVSRARFIQARTDVESHPTLPVKFGSDESSLDWSKLFGEKAVEEGK
jgi:hypothetical protein